MEALLFLGTHCKETGNFEEAELYCTRLLDFGGPKKEVRHPLRDLQDGRPRLYFS
jgi:anaphase-promoting complex subunit 8